MGARQQGMKGGSFVEADSGVCERYGAWLRGCGAVAGNVGIDPAAAAAATVHGQRKHCPILSAKSLACVK